MVPGAARSPAAARELTLRVFLLGLLLSAVMGAANVYLGLKAGMTVSASIPAAVVAMLILRGLLRTGTLLEANQVQTAASAGESLAAGIIFTLPALVLLGLWTEFPWWTTTLIALSGGVLGILFMIPMRRVFVLPSNDPDNELAFPEGVACARVLEAGDRGEGGAGDAWTIVWGALLGAAVKGLTSVVTLVRATVEGAVTAGGSVLYYGADISPALVAVGFIVRLNVAALIFIGGALAWLVALPILSAADASAEPALDQAWSLWSGQIRYIGVGAMVVAGLASIVKVRRSLLAALRELRRRPDAHATTDDRDRDLPGAAIAGLAALAILIVGGLYFHLTGDLPITLATTVIMVILAFFLTAVASYIVGLVGNSNSPVSGMTITAVLVTGGLLLLFGFTGEDGILATLGVAAVVCCVACTSGDVCNDLKTGSLVGATPWRQQVMQIAGVAIAAGVMAPVLNLLHETWPLGSRELSAPQAQLFASLASAFFGEGTLPRDMVYAGAALGAAILVLDGFLARRGATFRAHLMPIAVGMYLPFGLATPILLGGLMAHALARGTKTHDEAESRLSRGVLFGSGLIAGESLMGVGVALLFQFGLAELDTGLSDLVRDLVSIGAGLAILVLYRVAARRRAA